MHILIYLGHPAHFHLFKNSINELAKSNVISILSKKKDILDNLLIDTGLKYTNILPKGRKSNKAGIFLGLLKRDLRMFQFCLRYKPDIMMGTSPEICQIGKLLNISAININEDDAAAVPLYARLSYPFATEILTPTSCNNGRWNVKSIKYSSYHELAYLHPDHFTPNKDKLLKYNIKEPYFIIRFSSLDAHHDKGVKGLSDSLTEKILEMLKPHGYVYITSEKVLNKELDKYRLPIDPLDIHHVLNYANMYIGDSQTMTAESAVLGTPAIRFNDFVGKLGYLEELEKKYDLTYGFKTDQSDKLLKKIDEILKKTDVKIEWNEKKNHMLSEKINTSKFLVWFTENYPESAKIMKENPDYQYSFK